MPRKSFEIAGKPEQNERAMKIILTPELLRRWFGDTMLQQPVRVSDLSRATVIDFLRILDYPTEFVPIVTKHGFAEQQNPTIGNPQKESIKVVDKSALNAKLAQTYVSELKDGSRVF